MKIYAENGCVVFECDHCQLKSSLAPAKSKRGFMKSLNAFARKHDHMCKFKKDRQDKIDLSAATTAAILTNMLKSVQLDS